MRVTVLGAGSFGTALAHVFSKRATSVTIWARKSELVEHINLHRSHPSRFSELKFASHVRANYNLNEAIKDADVVVVALPMAALSSALENAQVHLAKNAVIVSTTKGIEPQTLRIPSAVIKEALSLKDENRLVALSGPNFASEIVHELPWATVIASTSLESAQIVQDLLKLPNVRAYYSKDTTGVQLGGALKNVFAIASGVIEGMNLGDNARAALITRGLAELSRFAQAHDADPKTLYGLSGLGDLLLSCTSSQSRNYRLGVSLAQGSRVKDIELKMGEVIEGVQTAQAAKKLAIKYSINAPICDAVYAVMFEDVAVGNALDALMNRDIGFE